MKIPLDRKMTFIEFMAYQDSDGYEIDNSWLNHWKEWIPKVILSDKHKGDCTDFSCSCEFCVVETYLKEYKEYFFEKRITNSSEVKDEN